MSEDKLKPCPFCDAKEYDCKGGSIAHSVVLFMWRWKIHYVECRNIRCDVNPKTLPMLTREEAIKAWNTRSAQ